jgi:hypothetical protein
MMDEDDNEYYNDQVEVSERNSNSLTHLLKQKRTVVRSAMASLNCQFKEQNLLLEGLFKTHIFIYIYIYNDSERNIKIIINNLEL